MEINIKEYIASGKIEEYVLGILPPEEQAEIEKIAQHYPEIQQEIALTQASLEAYAHEFAQNPPAHLKMRILNELDGLTLENTEDKQAPSPLSVSTNPNTHQLNLNKKNRYSFAFVAASVALAISLLGNVVLYQNWKNTQNKLQIALLDNTQFAQQLEVKQTQNILLNEELQILKNPQTQYVMLNGSEKYPEASVSVYWDKQSNEVFLQIQRLPKPPKGMQYQLWAVFQDKAIDAGVFDVDKKANQLQKMKNIQQADMFVVTLEKEGGVPQPEGEAYSLGKTS